VALLEHDRLLSLLRGVWSIRAGVTDDARMAGMKPDAEEGT